MADWFVHLHPAWQALIRVVLFVLPTLMLVPAVIWWERRLLSWMQDRIGPNRVGPFGLLQPIADGAKLMFKEDITPANVDRLIYFLAPALALFPAFTLGGTIPWGPFRSLTPVADVDIGVLYIMAISSLGVYGLVLAGYSANNKYSLMGGLRASAQLISYELAMGMSLACMVLATGSLKPTEMVRIQEGGYLGFDTVVANWHVLTPFGLVAAVVFFICMVAETNRAPFDLPEAENELVAGYHTEYSSFKFAVFFMGEYAAMVVWSAIFATVFLGGYHLLPIRFEAGSLMDQINGNSIAGPVWLLLKIAGMFSVYVWLRATLPRMRYDQLMSLGWKSLLPVATLNLILVAAWIYVAKVFGNEWFGFATWVVAGAILYMLFRAFIKTTAAPSQVMPENREVTLVNEPALREPLQSEPAVITPA
jgi:NADH-quinone oxidoreductase subunit H